ncbi:MAG: glycerol-3-phosphate acyltransferase [Ruminococcaceae bacterium]|nr:glycerol-3-phosphate acyltransferase [Oscillospiraceae bacterium]
MAFKIIVTILISYLIGSINPSYIIGRIMGIDIRQKGSGNAGASNATIVLGKWAGIFSGVFDILKSTAVMLIFPLIFKDTPFIAEIAGVACIIGHIFPIFMKFRGGKGLACFGGLVLAIDPRLFGLVLAAEILLLLMVDYICIVPITAVIIIPIVYGVFGNSGLGWLWRAAGGWWGAAIIGIASVVMLQRHLQNIKRIAKGKELRFSYIWMSEENKQKELMRVGKLEEKVALTAHFEHKNEENA